MANENEVVPIAEAAAECGVSVEVFIQGLLDAGLLLEHPNGGYIPSPHPDIRRVDE